MRTLSSQSESGDRDEVGGARTRRGLIAGGLGASTTFALATLWQAVPPALARGETDAELIAKALGVQQLELFAYGRLRASSELSPDAVALLAQLHALEVEHVAALAAQLVRLGSAVPAGPGDLGAADVALARHGVSGRLAGKRSQHECVKLLIDLESVAEGACYAAIADLADPELGALAAEMMGSEAQQWTLLDQLQHHDVVQSVPGPFVEGST